MRTFFTEKRIQRFAFVAALLLFFQLSATALACHLQDAGHAPSAEELIAASFCSSDSNSDSGNGEKEHVDCGFCMHHSPVALQATIEFDFLAQAQADSQFAIQQQKAHQTAYRYKSSRAPPAV